ncbi:hypothetical protein BKA65DRAFT_595913 [Rhexocercosporidium sp. MPI-PUGE-AT-0058]|nr:hypothetical protein BKA65DRAFT_595913 [Rhexocercosporidium sp. MPI-PUGE-AT-0058]
MSTARETEAEQLPDSRTILLQELKDIVDEISRLVGEGNGNSSWTSFIRRIRPVIEARNLNLGQELQRTSAYLGDLIRHVSGQASSSHEESTTRDRQGAEVEQAPISTLVSASNEPGEPSITPAISIILAPEAPENCTICFEAITRLCILQPCGHRFDIDCIMPWLIHVYAGTRDESTLRCPLCRQVIDTIRHSIAGDGTANMMVVGPHFGQQFGRPGPARPWDDLMRAARTVPVYRPSFPFFDAVDRPRVYQPSRGNTLHHISGEQLRLNTRRDSIHPHYMREDHINDEATHLTDENILNLVERIETMNSARERELEGMGEGASRDLHNDWRRSPAYGGLALGDENSAARRTWLQGGSASGTHPVIQYSGDPPSEPAGGESSQRTPPATRIPSTGFSYEVHSTEYTGRASSIDTTQQERTRDDGLRGLYDEEVVRWHRRRMMERGWRS